MVMSKTLLIRQVTITELHTMWDYEGKLESTQWSKLQGKEVLRHRIMSPPAKIIRTFLSKAADTIMSEVMGPTSEVTQRLKVKGPTVGLTKDVAFSPLEVNVDTRVAATQADDAKVDLSTWALPNETLAQSKVREVLRRFAVRWWARNLHQKAWEWWRENGKKPADANAIWDCLRRAQACTYWQWVRGSRIHFWTFDEEFREDF